MVWDKTIQLGERHDKWLMENDAVSVYEIMEKELGRNTDCKEMLAGAGDVPSTLNFYKKCGFSESHQMKFLHRVTSLSAIKMRC